MPKIESKLQKKRKEKQIHPNSRKAAQLSKELHKLDKRQKRKDEHDTKSSALRDKIFWFKSQLSEDKDRYSLVEVSNLISSYINRFEDRLDEIKKQNELNKEQKRHGHAHASEENAIKMVFEKEHGLFVAGHFEVPDLTNRKNVKFLRNWDGDVKDLPNIKLKNFKEQKLISVGMDIEEGEEEEEVENVE